jgi:parallel beta-helix repeat protein
LSDGDWDTQRYIEYFDVNYSAADLFTTLIMLSLLKIIVFMNGKNVVVLIGFLFIIINVSATIYKVSNEDEFNIAAAKAKAGDEIVIKNGTYKPWQLIVNTHGAVDKRILIRAETSGKVVFTGEIRKPVFLLTGSYTEISGMTFSGCIQLKDSNNRAELLELKDARYCRVTDCSFINNISKIQFTPMLVISGRGEYNRLDHCVFSGNIDNQEVQVKITSQSTPLYTLIDNNLFKEKNKVSWKNANGGECVQIGQDPVLLGTKYSYCTVRDNRFVACNGESEVISNKSSGNKYINNYFENCRGELVMRGGHDCKIDSNTIRSGSGGIRINGTNHTITNNVLSGLPTGIRLMYGMSKGKAEIGFYVAASDCLITNNKISDAGTGIYIGDSKNADWTGKFDVKKYPSRVTQDVAPYNIKIADNVITDTKTPILHNEH